MPDDSFRPESHCAAVAECPVLLYETSQVSESHAPFTRAFTQMITHVFPARNIVIYARKSHLQAAFGEQDPWFNQVIMKPILDEDKNKSVLRTIGLLHATWGRQRPFVIFLTGEPHHIWAAKLFKRGTVGFRCHLVLHGDISAIRGQRSRNPLHRMSDYAGSIANANHPDVRFITLETHVAANLAAALPAASACIDVVRHPCIAGDDEAWQESDSSPGQIRFGLLGIAGPSKGLDVFARIALRVAQADAVNASFRLVGKVQRGWRDLDLSGIEGPQPFSEDWLPRSIYEQELAELRYVILPYNMDYYALAASGVLLDVLRWRKPVIAFATPAIDEINRRFGEIGHICADEAEMTATVRDLLANFDAHRYQTQRRNLDAACRSRRPEAVAVDYAQLLRYRWGERVAGSGIGATLASYR